MIKIENEEVIGWEAAIRGMRNPMNSWEKGDSFFCRRGDCIKCEMNGKGRIEFHIGMAVDDELFEKLNRRYKILIS